MIRHMVITLVICMVSVLEVGNSYRILGVFPTPSISHQVVFRGLTLALNERGHELVIVTTNPVNNSALKNYTEIDIGFTYEEPSMQVDFIEYRRTTNWFEFSQGHEGIHLITEAVLNHTEVQKLYAPNSNEKFDLMLIELLFYPGLLPLAQRFDIPIIGITSLGLTTYGHYSIGNPIMPSHDANWELEMRLSKQPSFWQRLDNYVTVFQHLYWFRTTFMSAQREIAEKYLGNDIADPSEIEKNVSLVFVNQQGPISYGRPNTPNVIEIGGFHVSKKVTPLPKDLQQVLDEATEGFIYVSLGSNVKSVMLPKETLNEFITAFSRLPYKVLWKFEDDMLPNKPDNVHIMKWVPQQAVLAHPNLKVFVYQGGLQSTEEAVAHAVPLIGFPVMADQEMQVNKMVSLGVALKLEITAVDGKELLKTIDTVATDSSFKQNMRKLSSLIKDKPYDPMKNAVWWTEYVIRHKGAAHLRSSTVDEPWYSRQDVDIIAFISAVSVLGLTLLSIGISRLFKVIYFFNVSSQYRKKKFN